MAPSVFKKEPTKKEKLMHEMHVLEQELLDYGNGVSESQVWHKKARIETIKKQIAEIDKKNIQSFGTATDKLKSEMQQKDLSVFNMANSGGRD